MGGARNRGQGRELEPELSFVEVGPIPPEQFRDALRLLVTWASRGPGGRNARSRNRRQN
jgi:hypothetical protein